MTTAMPNEVWVPAPANPIPYGLYGAAAVTEADTPSRLAHGLTVRNINCGPSGVWSIDYCADPGTATKGDGDRPDNGDFAGLVVWAADNCSMVNPEQESRERAAQILRLHEQIRVEEAVAPVLTSLAGAATAKTTLVEAVGYAEQAIGQFGFHGVIHAAAHLAAQAAKDNLIVRNGTTLTTPLGHKWAFGGGYDTLGETLYATGPVAIQRGPVVPSTGLGASKNERLVLIEREVLVAWECFTLAVTTGA
ncbi:hypothetical protein [Rhodococcus koreensis]